MLALAAGGAAGAAPEDSPAGSGAELEEVVITAQKRPEKLQDVPVSAAVVSAQALANADVADLSDLNKLVPSVQLNGTINGRVPTGVRGISSVSNEQTVGISSGVAITIDAPPAGGAYWEGLHSRIMANIDRHRVSVIPVNWWSDLASWTGPGLAAAALL